MRDNTIYLKTNKYDYWAEKFSHSELLLSHINHGSRKFYYHSLGDIGKLAEIHGWELDIKEFKQDE